MSSQRRLANTAVAIALHCGLIAGLSASPSLAQRTQPRPESVGDAVVRLAEQAGRALEVAPDLATAKVIILLQDGDEEGAINGLATLLGSEWKIRRADDGSAVARLERRPGVTAWSRERLAARERSDLAARAEFRQHLLEHWALALSEIDVPMEQRTYRFQLLEGAARAVRAFPREALVLLADWYATLSAVRPGTNPSATFQTNRFDTPVKLPFEQLPVAGRQAVEELMSRRRPRSVEPALWDRWLRQSTVALGTMYGTTIEVQVYMPDQAAPRWFPAFGTVWTSKKLASVSDDNLLRGLAGLPTPADALLGARFDEDGQPAPRMRVDAALAQRGATPPPAPSRLEFIAWLREATGLTVIADHCTLSDRASLKPGAFGDVLATAGETFGTVFRQDGDTLLARRAAWPEDDLLEFAAPHPEDWIATLLRRQPLALEDLAVIATGSDGQLGRLSLFKDTGIAFNEHIELLFSQPALRGFLTACKPLDEAQRKRLRSDEGLPLAEATEDLQAGIRLMIMSVNPPNVITAQALERLQELRLLVIGVPDPTAEITGRPPRPVLEIALRLPTDGGKDRGRPITLFVVENVR